MRTTGKEKNAVVRATVFRTDIPTTNLTTSYHVPTEAHAVGLLVLYATAVLVDMKTYREKHLPAIYAEPYLAMRGTRLCNHLHIISQQTPALSTQPGQKRIKLRHPPRRSAPINQDQAFSPRPPFAKPKKHHKLTGTHKLHSPQRAKGGRAKRLSSAAGQFRSGQGPKKPNQTQRLFQTNDTKEGFADRLRKMFSARL